jgi:SAM-dependent methyltransferase
MDPLQRFTDRVEHYVRGRPAYPREMLDALAAECGLTPDSVIADLGSGTGILSRPLLDRGCTVFGVEPNAAMREAAECAFADQPRFRSVAAAEATTLADASVDPIVAGQAFHWFDRERARREFARILRPGGRVALIWNERRTTGDPFLEAYENLLRECAVDYDRVNHRETITEEVLRAFFAPAAPRSCTLPNVQHLDERGLRDRVLSCSYMPAPEHPGHEPMLRRMQAMFHEHRHDGRVGLIYDTRLWYGRLD